MRSRGSGNRNVLSPMGLVNGRDPNLVLRHTETGQPVWTNSGKSHYVPDKTHRAEFHNICIRVTYRQIPNIYNLDGIFSPCLGVLN
jgi:hypothetical protein